MDHESVPKQEPPLTETSSGISLTWKLIFAGVALVIVGLLAYPLLQEQTSTGASANPDSSAKSPAAAGSEVVIDTEGATAEELFDQGNAYFQAGQLEQAVAAYQKAIELKPDYQAVYANLGVAYYQLEQLDLAAAQYEKALELDPADGEVAYNLGALKLQQALASGQDPKLIDEAIAQLQHSLELAPDLAEPHFSLGVAYAQLNQTEQAIQAFERFLAQDSGLDPRASQEAQRYLESLKSQ